MFGFVIEYNKSVVGFTICEATPIFTSEARAQSSVANWKSDESVFFEAIKN